MSKTIKISPCPACEYQWFRKLFIKNSRHFYKCLKCGLEKQYPLPDKKELYAYYDNSYINGMYKIFSEAHHIKYLTAKLRFNEIIPYCRKGRWLDVGCSDGIFIKYANEKGIDAEGIDISKTAVDNALKQGLRAYPTTLEEHKSEFLYDTITFFDLLEHVRDPVSLLISANSSLMSNGTIVITIPNLDSIIKKIMGRRWLFYIPEEHFHYFNLYNLRLLLKRTGFTIKSWKRTYKSLTYNYTLSQLKEYNPILYTIFNSFSKLLPSRALNHPFSLYIGEIIVFGRVNKL